MYQPNRLTLLNLLKKQFSTIYCQHDKYDRSANGHIGYLMLTPLFCQVPL